METNTSVLMLTPNKRNIVELIKNTENQKEVDITIPKESRLEKSQSRNRKSKYKKYINGHHRTKRPILCKSKTS